MRPYTAILIVPTGVGAAIGGYAGDALPVARAMAEVCDVLITHPNVLNGATLYWNLSNALYVEGYGIDQFCQGNWGLQPVHQNKIGLIFDKVIEPDLRLRNLQAADAARATLGLSLTDYVVTDAPLNVELRSSQSGASWGTIGNPGSLLRAAESLINKTKASAIAVVARFPDDIDEEAEQNYRQGKGVDPIAGAEAVISHLIVREFGIPCAHAPIFTPPPLEENLSPRSAAEEIGYTFLPSVLVGLSRSPQFISRESNQFSSASDIWVNQVDAVVVPANACGSSAVLSLSQNNTQIITVEENQTQMQVSSESLGIKTISVSSYLEAVGILAARKAGVDPSILSSTIFSLQQ
ncbi:MAG: DUF3326 domain-containing protein [Rivularia sp. ALOHA_DT_140]|nr:DUF3326 domain-containing protein [Rivularia sp. ALOHA_DT_140]